MNKKILSLIIGLFLFLASFTGLVVAEEEIVCAYYFYGTGCHACEVIEPHLAELENKYDFFELKQHEVWFNKDNNELLAKFYGKYGVDGGGTPTVIIDEQVLIGTTNIQNNLENIILKNKGAGLSCPVPGDEVPTIGVLALIGAAAVDAINPCALAVLILLLTTILVARRKKIALYAGLAFTSAVYLSYLLMGSGLFYVFEKLAWFGKWMKLGVGTLALLVGLFNLKDFIRPGAFGFKAEVPQSWRPKMKALIMGVTSIPGAFVVGLLVSLFLLPCTSGPYIVVCGMLANYSTFWSALPLLFLYNLIFVSPMILLTVLVYYGMKPRVAEKWRVQRSKYLHLIAGLILVALGILLLVGYL